MDMETKRLGEKRREEKKRKENLWFFNGWASWYDYSIGFWMEYVQRKIVDLLDIGARDYILDASCGTGELLKYLQKTVPLAKLQGLDLSPKMLQVAEKKLRKEVTLKLGDVEDIPFSNGSFDIVFSTEAFHHYLHPPKVLQEFRRILMPKGILVIADVNFNCPVLHWLYKKFEPGHVNIYSKEQFRQMLKNAGFKVLSQKRIGLFAIATIGVKERKTR